MRRLPTALLAALASLSLTAATAQAGPESGDFQFPGADTTNNGAAGYITFGASAGKLFVPFSYSGTPNAVGTSNVVNGDAMSKGPGKWAEKQSDIWTPSPYYDPGTNLHFLFYTATKDGTGGKNNNPRKCIGAASSASIEGPYKDVGEPLACPTAGSADNPRWALDADVVAGPDGTVYMTWRDGQRAVGGQSALSVATVGFKNDGTAVRTSNGSVLFRSNKLPWAQRNGRGVTVIENPTAVYNAGSWYLFYSGNSFETNAYSTGIAYCGSNPKLGSSPCTPMPGPKRATFAYDGPGGLPKKQRLLELPGNKRGPGAMDVYRLIDGSLGVTWNYITQKSRGKNLTRLSRSGHLLVTGTGPNAQFQVVE